jgi:hypothetical protein
LPDIVDWDGKELAVQEFENLTLAQRSAIKRLVVRRIEREHGIETVIEIEVKDSLEAGKEINKMLGFYQREPEGKRLPRIQINFDGVRSNR